MKANVLVILFTIINFTLYSQNQELIKGKWTTFDGDGKLTGEIELYFKNDKLYGVITRAFSSDGKESPDVICKDCIGERNNKKIVGMTVVEGLSYDTKKEAYYGKKACFAPQQNLMADGKIWLDKNDKDILYLRGSVSIFHETQRWLRVK
ncbi:MAG: DUF2147 domain-containing protein [Bacteroidales bacterium]|nr:DUF2147 domain-containing protein [Bacteroidales bacterium]MDD2204939.1 DUF2147 domain-containing protein [Bacteroidales bacterium]MDD3152786.1 DUF2147 domain-containing protein [Bacteroidales bacterium]MDD3915198.1 DUF2147 domain-containing protein [Bacteroidales bacterium]MDD4634910.1 DUF2147 domain-containing protein [Bacteroidales bacterium]